MEGPKRVRITTAPDGGDGGGAGRAPAGQGRTLDEVLHPQGSKGSWRELPGLLRSSLELVWQSGRREFLITASIQMATALSYALLLLLARSLLHAVLGAHSLAAVWPWLVAVVGITIALDFARAIENEQSRLLAELVGQHALDRVIDTATAADLLEFEDPVFHDRLRRAQMQGQFRALQTVNGLLGLAGALVAAGTILAALTALEPLLLPLLLVGYIPLALVTRLNSRDTYVFSFGMTPNDRQRNYLLSLMTGRDQAKELRAFDLAPFVRGLYDTLYEERIGEFRRLSRRRALRALLGAASSSAVAAVGVGGLAWLYVSGRMSLATAGAAIFGLTQLSARLAQLHFSANSLYEATLFIRDYRSFVETDEQPRPDFLPAPRGFAGLAAEGVSFSYPDAVRPALDDVSLEIEPGEIVALVGENGSGKTTLAKLLAGLYRPDRGRLLWNGADTASIDPRELREQVAVIFQDFERYRLTARQNIGLGRHDRLDDGAAIEAAGLQADADEFIRQLPAGYDTMLGREFSGGYDLSIGQWQRVALARAFFRDAPFVILDEPTAALDARAESRLFERIRILLAGRSVLLISHRFSSVRCADRIYVLEHGRIAEHGTHETLLASGGTYAELYALQAAANLIERGPEPRVTRGDR
jgi:ABC-type multidrug transport system fused ATPase/permease subunit